LVERIGHVAVAIETDIAGQRRQVVFALGQTVDGIAKALPYTELA
jgi:hypothetical protein